MFLSLKKIVLSCAMFVLATVSSSASAFASDVLVNCFASSTADYFSSQLEDMAQNDAQPVLLLNEKKEVVGAISVSPVRDSKTFKSKNVVVNSIRLCSIDLEVDDFYYADGVAENLLTWVGAKKDSVRISQDEGLLVVNASIVKDDNNTAATLIRAEFKAYDVFTEEEDVNTLENRRKPGFIKDWGVPRGTGVFYFFIPSDWTL